MVIKNPLRYPGAKSKLYGYMYNLLNAEGKRGCTFYEPFAGSAALSLMLLENNVIQKAVINELDPLLYYFWHSVFFETNDLVHLIETTPITLESWNNISQYREDDFIVDKSPVEIGFAGLFLNRTNYSGILKANPLGGIRQESEYKINCRFNRERVIDSIRQISAFRDRIEVFNLDAIEFMKKQLRYKRNNNIFVYIDPPYYLEGPGLYRCFYNRGQHERLAKFILKKNYPWLISYDDVEEIRKIYSRFAPISIYMDYSVHTSKKGKELLISNLKIPPMEQQDLKTLENIS